MQPRDRRGNLHGVLLEGASMRLGRPEDIHAVAEMGSSAKTARRGRPTPSAFSRRRSRIEARLGVELADRRSKPVRPTTRAPITASRSSSPWTASTGPPKT